MFRSLMGDGQFAPGQSSSSSGLDGQESSWMGLFSRPALSFIQRYLPGPTGPQLPRPAALTDSVWGSEPGAVWGSEPGAVWGSEPGAVWASESGPVWGSGGLNSSLMDTERELVRHLEDIMPQRGFRASGSGLKEPPGGRPLPWLTPESLQELGITPDSQETQFDLCQNTHSGYLTSGRTLLPGLSSVSAQDGREKEWGVLNRAWWGGFSSHNKLFTDVSWTQTYSKTPDTAPAQTPDPTAVKACTMETCSVSVSAAPLVGTSTVKASSVDTSSMEASSVDTCSVEVSTLETCSVSISAAPTVDTTTVDTSSVEASTVVTSSVVISSVEASTVVTSSVVISSVEASILQASTVETCSVDTSSMETCSVETCSVEASTVEASTVETCSVLVHCAGGWTVGETSGALDHKEKPENNGELHSVQNPEQSTRDLLPGSMDLLPGSMDLLTCSRGQEADPNPQEADPNPHQEHGRMCERSVSGPSDGVKRRETEGESSSAEEEEEEAAEVDPPSADPQCQNKAIAYIMGCPCSEEEEEEEESQPEEEASETEEDEEDDEDVGFDSDGSSAQSDSSDSDSGSDSESERLWNALCRNTDPCTPRTSTTASLKATHSALPGPKPSPKQTHSAPPTLHSSPKSTQLHSTSLSISETCSRGTEESIRAFSPTDAAPQSPPQSLRTGLLSPPTPLLSPPTPPQSPSTPPQTVPSPPSSTQSSPASSPPSSSESWDESASETDEAESLRLWSSFSGSSDPYSPFNFQAPLRTKEPNEASNTPTNTPTNTPSNTPNKNPSKTLNITPVPSPCSPPVYSRDEAEERLDSGFSEPATSSRVIKKVRFSEVVQEFFTCESGEVEDRRGPWEELARDRCRFLRRCVDVEQSIGFCLTPLHRQRVYERISVCVCGPDLS